MHKFSDSKKDPRFDAIRDQNIANCRFIFWKGLDVTPNVSFDSAEQYFNKYFENATNADPDDLMERLSAMDFSCLELFGGDRFRGRGVRATTAIEMGTQEMVNEPDARILDDVFGESGYAMNLTSTKDPDHELVRPLSQDRECVL